MTAWSLLGRMVNRLEEGVMALLLAAMTLLTFSQVILRYVFNTGFTWAHELTGFMFAWLIFLGMSYGVKTGAHIGIDAAVKLLPRGGQRFIGLAGALGCMAYAAILAKGGFDYVETMRMIGVEAEDLPVERWIVLSVLPFGFALLALRFFQVFARIAMGRQLGLGLADEAADAMKLEHRQDDAQEPGR